MTTSSSEKPTIDISNNATKEGLLAGRSAAKQLIGAAAPESARNEWICGFLRGFLEYGEAAALGARPTSAEDTDHDETTGKLVVPPLFAARVIAVETSPDGAIIQATVDIAGSGLVYQPGGSVALWPSNDPNTVRDIIRALSISAQTQVITAGGTFPIWQVLLEHLDVSICPSSTVAWLAEYARNPDEAQRLLQLARNPDQEHSLVSLLRRFPQVKPPIQQLLTKLAPIVPMVVPIASLLPDGKLLTFCAKLGVQSVAWGQVDAHMRSRLRVGEWLTISTELEQSLPLPDDGTIPTAIVASPTSCALAQAYALARHATNARGRTWIIVVAQENESVPGLDALQAMYDAGSLARFDVIRGHTAQAALENLKQEEETFWRWLVDHSCVGFAVETTELAHACDNWLLELLMRRGRCDHTGAATRIRELEASGRLLRLAPIAA